MADRLLRAVGQIYDCVGDASRWHTCLTTIGVLLRGTSTNLLYHDLRSRGGIQVAIGADPDLYRQYRDYGHAIDPWALACRPGTTPAGGVLIGASVVDHARMKKTEFYAAMGRRYETTRCVFGVLEASPHQAAVLSVNRGDRDEEFDSQDARLVSVLIPHIRRALAMHRRLGALDAHQAHSLDALDRLHRGLVLVDDHARPILVNRYAAHLVERRDGLTIEKGALVAAAPAAARRLASALGAAIAVSKGTAFAMTNGELEIPRSTRPPLLVSITPVGRLSPYGELTSCAAASVVVVDPDDIAWPPIDRLRELFSLTAAEARVAAALAAGSRVADISDEFGVTPATVRSQVKRILDKSGTRSQSSFIRLLVTESMRVGSPPEK
jgi:DNA-binding CsgD family transcriptional regulator